MLLYTLLVISFAQCKKYMISQITFSKFSDVLPAFTCARANGKLGVSILSPFSYFTLHLASNTTKE